MPEQLPNDFIQGTQEKEPTEVIDTKCAEIARGRIFNLKNWGKPLPVRVAYSGLMEKTYNNGFHEASFIYDRHSNFFEFRSFVNWTRNDAFNIGYGSEIRNGFKGKLPHSQRYLSHFGGSNKKIDEGIEKYINGVKEKFPEAFPRFMERVNKVRKGRMHVQDFFLDESGQNILMKGREEHPGLFNDIDEYAELFTDINGYMDYLRKGGGNEEIIKQVVQNILKGLSLEEWSFDQIDLVYTTFVNLGIQESEKKRIGRLSVIRYGLYYRRICLEKFTTRIFAGN